MSSLIIRNIHKKRMDVSIGDLRYKIPAGQARDLFSKTANLRKEDIMLSLHKGSLGKRIRQGVLLVVKHDGTPKPPKLKVADPNAIVFPQRTKSFIIIEPEKVKEELHRMIMAEDEELLKEMENEEEESKEEN